jgi:Leucine-rich repeat (LRR) protein
LSTPEISFFIFCRVGLQQFFTLNLFVDMKKLVLTTALLPVWLLLVALPLQAALVTIPDNAFRIILENHPGFSDCMVGTPGNKQLDTDCAATKTGTLVLANTGITNLAGIEYFTSLQKLECYMNPAGISTINLTGMVGLQEVRCFSNSTTSLIVSGLTNLKQLHCDKNNLSGLNLSGLTNLEVLNCSENQLTNLNVSQNTALKVLNCSANQLTNLDVSQNTALTILNCSYNQLSNLDVSQNTVLTNLACNNNPLSNLDITPNIALTQLYCSHNQLTTLDINANILLGYLDCSHNQLTNLNVSQNTGLTTLVCNNNQLSSLDVSQNIELLDLYISDNPINGFVGTLPNKLYYLEAYNTNITCLPNVPNDVDPFWGQFYTEVAQDGMGGYIICNNAPTDLALSPASIAENNAVNAVVGTFTTTDPDAGDSHTYSLVSGAGDADNAAFTISGDQLRANISFDFEVKNSYSICVRTTDQGNLAYEKVFTITITDVLEGGGPTIDLVPVSLPVSANEGSGFSEYLVNVVLSGATTYPVSVQFNTSGTAIRAQAAGPNASCGSKTVRDYSIAPSTSSGPVTLTWSSALTSVAKQLRIRINGDDCAEPDETIILTLTNPVNATLGTGTFTHTILNDDAPRLGEDSGPEALTTGLTLYPNPTQGALTLQFQANVEGVERLQVLDVAGRVVHTQTVHAVEGRNEVALDLSAQPAGVYFVQALGQTAKVVLAK